MLLPHTCKNCGELAESVLHGAGAYQIRQSCGECGAYIKFIHYSDMPTVTGIRAEIWTISNQRVSIIEKAKKAIGFKDLETDRWRRLAWYRVYREVYDMINSAEQRYETLDEEINF